MKRKETAIAIGGKRLAKNATPFRSGKKLALVVSCPVCKGSGKQPAEIDTAYRIRITKWKVCEVCRGKKRLNVNFVLERNAVNEEVETER